MPGQFEKSWPPDRIDKVGALLANGYSASQAAYEMGCTANSVISIAHRKNLVFTGQYQPWRPKVARPRSATPRRTTPFRPRVRRVTNHGNRFDVVEVNAPAPLPASRAVAEHPIAQRCTLLELNASTCRWPFGDPGAVDFYFCGGMVIEGKPYCPLHCRLAYRQPGQREEQAA